MVLWTNSFVVCVHKHIHLDIDIVCFGGAMRSVYFWFVCKKTEAERPCDIETIYRDVHTVQDVLLDI